VFTVAQNIEMVRDEFLFKEGLAHKYHRDDIFISIVAMLSLFLGIANTVLLLIPLSFEFAIPLGVITISLNKLSFISPLVISLSATGLAMCFLSILYYFRRTFKNIEAKVADETLKKALEKATAKPESQSISPGPENGE